MAHLQRRLLGRTLVLALTMAACSGGGGGGNADGGAVPLGAKSPGTVTLRLVIPTDRTFCDQSTSCATDAHVAIRTASGIPLAGGIPFCSTICSAACTPSLCPGIACISQGIAVKTTEIQWDGSSYATSTCGAKTTCYKPGFVAAGHYVAHMCATPGTLSSDGGFPQTCTATGPVECVDVPFDLPATSPVEGVLP